jgi:hypothetical protein
MSLPITFGRQSRPCFGYFIPLSWVVADFLERDAGLGVKDRATDVPILWYETAAWNIL